MGQAKSKESRNLAQKTHFSEKEINKLRKSLAASSRRNDRDNITEDIFKKTVQSYVPHVSSDDDVFLTRLYAALDVDNDKRIHFSELVDGLSKFMKGTRDEKLAVSFNLYDVNHDGYLTQPNLERIMMQLSKSLSDKDQTNAIKQMVNAMFEDLDVDGDGKLSFEEYRLSAMKEPLVVDFLEQFLSKHHISESPCVPASRPGSMRSNRSGRSGRSSTPNRPPSSPALSRLSVRVSQAELLEFSHQQQQRLGSVPTSPTLSNHSPRSIGSRNCSPIMGPTTSHSPRMQSRRLSRPPSMTSLDAAVNLMDDKKPGYPEDIVVPHPV